MNTEIINENIKRAVIPFLDVFTTVYLIRYDGGYILFDTATYASDVDNYIIPILKEEGIDAEELKYIFISHNHGDHSGGLSRLLEFFPSVKVISRSPALSEKFPNANILNLEDGYEFERDFCLIAIPGHSRDSAALYDSRTKTLITGDSLQLYGLFGSGEWGSNIGLPSEYFEALEKLEKMDIESVYTAHDFHPYGYAYVGKEAVKKALSACRAPILEIKAMIEENPTLTDAEIREKYNSQNLPTVRLGVFAAVRNFRIK